MKFSLQFLLAVCYCVTRMILLISAIVCIAFPEYALGLEGKAIFSIIPGVSYCQFLTSGFVLLMLAKERSDMQVQEIQKNLQKSEFRFQQIVETAIEGILIFDEHYRITFMSVCVKSAGCWKAVSTDPLIWRPVMEEKSLPVYCLIQTFMLQRKQPKRFGNAFRI